MDGKDDHTRDGHNVVRLPREWLGPPEELVPVGDAARARAAERERRQRDGDTIDDALTGRDGAPAISAADDFWSSGSGAVHQAVLGPTASRDDRAGSPAASAGGVDSAGAARREAVATRPRPRRARPRVPRMSVPRLSVGGMRVRRPRSARPRTAAAVLGALVVAAVVVMAVIGGSGSSGGGHSAIAADHRLPSRTLAKFAPLQSRVTMAVESVAEKRRKAAHRREHAEALTASARSGRGAHRVDHLTHSYTVLLRRQRSAQAREASEPATADPASPVTASSDPGSAESTAEPATYPTAPSTSSENGAGSSSSSSAPATSSSSGDGSSAGSSSSAPPAPAGPTGVGSASGCDPQCS